MKFVYEYHTSSNERRRGEVRATDRDGAFRKLRKIGIRPSWLGPAPGFFNLLFGTGKRWIAIVVLVIALTVVLIRMVSIDRQVIAPVGVGAESPRHQIYGDPSVLEEWMRNDYAAVFSCQGERVLARYAQPGIVPMRLITSADVESLRVCLTNKIVFVSDDIREVSELKQIVNWMKSELKAYLANGNGTARSYARRLRERLAEEVRIRELVEQELEMVDDEELLCRRNRELRELGLKTIVRDRKFFLNHH